MNPFTVNQVAAATSPFNCAWIQRGSIRKIGSYTYAVCTRVPDFPRTVNESDCMRCPLWQEPLDMAAEVSRDKRCGQ
jgi:hypothetical protein